MRKRHGFTLIELMIVLIVLAILAAIAIPIYRNQIEKTKADVSAANLEVILEAWKITCMKNDVSPAEMSRLWNKYGEDAFVIVQENKKNFMFDIFSLDSVYADGDISTDDSWVPPGHGRDPSDPRPNATFSYGLNSAVAGMSWRDIQKDTTLNGAVPIIAEFDSTSTKSTFTGLDGVLRTRHRKGSTRFGLFINRDGEVYAIADGSSTPVLYYKNWR